MRARVLTVIAVAGIVAAFACAISSVPSSDASLQFCGTQTNNFDENDRVTIHTFVVANFCLTNAARPIASIGAPYMRRVSKVNDIWTTNPPPIGDDISWISPQPWSVPFGFRLRPGESLAGMQVSMGYSYSRGTNWFCLYCLAG